MLTIGTTVLGVNDVARATAFWCDALGYVPREEGDETWVVLVPQKGEGARLALMLSETPVQPHPRIHLDLYADDQAGEVERLLGLGAPRRWTGTCIRRTPISSSWKTRTETGSASWTLPPDCQPSLQPTRARHERQPTTKGHSMD